MKKIGRRLWLLLILSALLLWALFPDALKPSEIHAFLERYESWALVIYVLISSVRGCFLIPSTPFVLAGILLFPEQPIFVFFSSLFGVLVGSGLIYFFSDRLGFAEVLEKKHAKLMDGVRRKMKRHGMLIVIGWSFFPFVPTDLICYLAGVIRMSFWKFILAVALGEAVLIGGYVFLGKAFFEILSCA